MRKTLLYVIFAISSILPSLCGSLNFDCFDLIKELSKPKNKQAGKLIAPNASDSIVVNNDTIGN